MPEYFFHITRSIKRKTCLIQQRQAVMALVGLSVLHHAVISNRIQLLVRDTGGREVYP